MAPFASLLLIAAVPESAVAGTEPGGSPDLARQIEVLSAAAPGLAPEVLAKALTAHGRARRQGLLPRGGRLTVIDYSLPSTEPRLWVFDLPSNRLLMHEWVAHGRNSGGNHTSRFSNQPGSFQSSLGLFVTEASYAGANGYSLKLQGLEPGINDRAGERAIVIHGAAYVNSSGARRLGRLGRSLGCPAVSPQVARRLIDAIRDGSAVFAWYPEASWLRVSRFLAD